MRLLTGPKIKFTGNFPNGMQILTQRTSNTPAVNASHNTFQKIIDMSEKEYVSNFMASKIYSVFFSKPIKKTKFTTRVILDSKLNSIMSIDDYESSIFKQRSPVGRLSYLQTALFDAVEIRIGKKSRGFAGMQKLQAGIVCRGPKEKIVYCLR